MLESQICLWCIFVNNLPDKVSWLLKLFETIIFYLNTVLNMVDACLER